MVTMEVETKVDFPKFLKIAMEKAHLTQLAFSKLLGIGQSQVSNWLNGRSLPGYYSIRQICVILGLSADELLELN